MVRHRLRASAYRIASVAALSLLANFAPSQAHERLLRVHHGEMPSGAAGVSDRDAVSNLMQIANDACYERGDSSDALRSWAQYSHWMPATPEQLGGVPENDFTQVVAGWTVTSTFGATAIIQSKFRGREPGHVCSVTAILPDINLHTDAKSAFQKQFGTVIAEEHDVPDQHTDRFWIERDKDPPVKASMVFTPSRRMITIRMIHGNARPLRS